MSVEGLFKRLPVRRRDLEKNIKREYGKVLGLLHAYACIGTGVRFSVKNTVGKTKNVVVFTTSGNPSTKQNIANVYGAKTLSALMPLELSLEFKPSVNTTGRRFGGGGGSGGGDDEQSDMNKIQVRGHISRPVFGEGRQTPDRQMFFVNSRPCGLPQIAKAFNEVYKSFNVSQSPFIFADFHMDTNAYDVNVSPDKRTILLHDAGAMIESLKTSLTEMFEASDQTVPQSQPSLKQQFLGSQSSMASSRPSGSDPAAKGEKEDEDEEDEDQGTTEEAESSQQSAQSRMKNFLQDIGGRSRQADPPPSPVQSSQPTIHASDSSPVMPTRPKLTDQHDEREESPVEEENETPGQHATQGTETAGDEDEPSQSTAVSDEQPASSSQADAPIDTPNTIQNAYDRMRPRRLPAEVATITIGDKTVTSMVGSGVPKKRAADTAGSASGSINRKRRIHTPSRPNIFGQFAAPGLQEEAAHGEDEEDEDEVEAEKDEEYSEDNQEKQGDDQYPSESDHAAEEVQDTASPKHDADVDPEIQDSQVSAAPNDKEMTEEEKKVHEEAEVQRLIQEAEDKAALPEENNANRANKINKGAAHRDSAVHLNTSVDGSLSKIQSQVENLRKTLRSQAVDTSQATDAEEAATSQQTAEDRLSLTVTKDDFANMRIIGQFNLGFILATRSSSSNTDSSSKDELFIIDQHASDEKINFERLQATTIVQNQRLVQPKTLDLTAVEEEIVLENRSALEKNGFIVAVDDSGNEPIGRRCKLVSLPLSKEVVFGIRDLEELIVLLSEMPSSTATAGPGDSGSDVYIPRPDKVRKMFAMRACRSSIMIGKNLTQRQMERVVRDMGAIDKPWNCPHGRPTMRHLMSLGQWDEWDEFGMDGGGDGGGSGLDTWREYFQEVTGDDEE